MTNGDILLFSLAGRRIWKPPPTLLNWGLVQKKLPWHIMLLLGGAFALAKGGEVHTTHH